MSNSKPLLQRIDLSLIENLQTGTVEIRDSEVISVLGLVWNPSKDSFGVKLNLKDFRVDFAFTKRVMLSEIAQVFDLLGILSPVTIRAKIILQDLWRAQVGWDDSIAKPLEDKFREYYLELLSLKSFSMPRCYSLFDKIVSKQIVGFCDASERAYCAVVYLKTIDSSGKVENRFVCSKTRVAPVKSLAIPRLELQSAVLLSQLTSRIACELSIRLQDVILFSDSTVVLHWLRGSPDRWTAFVKN